VTGRGKGVKARASKGVPGKQKRTSMTSKPRFRSRLIDAGGGGEDLIFEVIALVDLAQEGVLIPARARRSDALARDFAGKESTGRRATGLGCQLGTLSFSEQ